MKLTLQIFAILIIVALASPLFLLHGCGSSGSANGLSLNGGQCGGCPSATAPSGSTVAITSGLTSYTVSAGNFCVNRVVFTFMDKDGVTPLNNICAEFFTNGGITLSQGGLACDSRELVYSSYIRTSTDSGGTVTLDFETGDLSCGNATTNQSLSLFIQGTSCSDTATTTGSFTLTCP